MNTHAEKPLNSIASPSNVLTKHKKNSEVQSPFLDNRPVAIIQQQFKNNLDNSPQALQLKKAQQIINGSNQVLQLKEGDSHYGVFQTGPLIGDDCEEENGKSVLHIKKLHQENQYEIAEGEDISGIDQENKKVVKFTEGKGGIRISPTAKDIQAEEMYPSQLETENAGNFKGWLRGTQGNWKYKRNGAPEHEGLHVAGGTFEFVVTGDVSTDGVMLSKKGHTSMTYGKGVYYAGEVEFEAGVVKSWNNKSGHYKPKEEDAVISPFPMDKFAGWVEPEAEPEAPVENSQAQLIILAKEMIAKVNLKAQHLKNPGFNAFHQKATQDGLTELSKGKLKEWVSSNLEEIYT